MRYINPRLLYLLYLVPFLRYSAFNNGVTLKSGLEVVQDHWKWYTIRFRKLGDGFLFACNSRLTIVLSYIISEMKPGRKSRFIPPLHLTSPLSEYCHKVWYGKLEWYSNRRWKSLMICLTIPVCDGWTERRMDGQTSCDSKVCAMHSVAR